MYSGETADQTVRMTLQGIEIAANVAIKLGESAQNLLNIMSSSLI